jgi:hypothetical protein
MGVRSRPQFCSKTFKIITAVKVATAVYFVWSNYSIVHDLAIVATVGQLMVEKNNAFEVLKDWGAAFDETAPVNIREVEEMQEIAINLKNDVESLEGQITHLKDVSASELEKRHDKFKYPIRVLETHIIWMSFWMCSTRFAVVFTGLAVVAARKINMGSGTCDNTNDNYWPVTLFSKYGDNFAGGLLDGEFFVDQGDVECLLPTALLVAINIIYLFSIARLFVHDVIEDSKWHLLKWKIWTRVWFSSKTRWNLYWRIEEKAKFKNFLTACRTGNDKTLLKSLLHDADFNPNQKHPVSGDTGLHIACQHGQLSVVQAMLDVKRKAININIENVEGQTPLMIVAAKGDKTMLTRLFKGAKLKLKNQYGDQALYSAVVNEHYIAAQTICEEMTRRGLFIKDLSILSYLNRCIALSKNNKNNYLSKDQCHKSLYIYKSSILNALKKTDNIVEHEPLSQQGLLEELREYLECPICYEEFGASPINACSNDHWICCKCLPRNSCCPWCRESFQTCTPKRCRTSEKILKIVTMIEINHNNQDIITKPKNI